MTGQLALIDTPAQPKLTERQTFTLTLLTDAGVDGITADEAGAAWCAQRGKHPIDTRCAHDAQNGQQVLTALRTKGLAKYRRRKPDGAGGDWVPVDVQPPAMLAHDEAIPY